MLEPTELIILYVFFFLGMTAFALLINRVLLRFVKTLGTKNQPGAVVRWSEETKPAIGGLAFFIIFLISLCVYSIVFDPNNIFASKPILGLLLAGTLGFILGLTDDAYNTRPILKFFVQVLCGIILVITNTRIEIFENETVNSVLTILWVIGIMNSINMLDNMDGIATSVTSFILVAALGYIIIHNQFSNVDFLILLGILAALIGFLFFNWHPSKMYMGDTGSQFLGVFLGYIGIEYCWNAETLDRQSSPLFGIAALLLVFILPLADTATVTINRLRRGQSPFVGGKDHTTHNLSYLGFSDKQVGGIFCLIAAFSVIFYLLLTSFGNAQNSYLSLICIVYFLVIFLLLFGIAEYNKRRNIGVKDPEPFSVKNQI
ncbi:undecaprenyl/decaprenyl-phosphate alpha-N-acetylglucosaminyl 1-phosphate transferase [Cryomorpha ignava]|uniref:Undecaprenyl/decaprenyl-phosphate alpha-N-acetylglucosaminyl 1-phosphate transferase n=1 Tax=Cryomorpha ignava TaxID=101383 RepID=A0A7K3WU28_9FLAO|nr:MraY family glycosyltransferase [Cryomorpha ignava]NEN25180.1 undecaprenyl/decaprenyl-phosphate alpha-N-acetylglucosaminyl 1-phosphate transferase [Cryomorpha ignava]